MYLPAVDVGNNKPTADRLDNRGKPAANLPANCCMIKLADRDLRLSSVLIVFFSSLHSWLNGTRSILKWSERI